MVSAQPQGPAPATQQPAATPVVAIPPGSAAAPPPRFARVDRRGFLIGFSLGGGSFSLDDCSACESVDGVALDFHIGGMLNQRVGLMYDGFGVSDENVTHAISTFAAQFWATPRLWFKAGLGVGQLTISDSDGDQIAASDAGAGFLLAAGVELIQTDRFALDLQLRGATVAYENSESISMGSLGLGFNWY